MHTESSQRCLQLWIIDFFCGIVACFATCATLFHFYLTPSPSRLLRISLIHPFACAICLQTTWAQNCSINSFNIIIRWILCCTKHAAVFLLSFSVEIQRRIIRFCRQLFLQCCRTHKRRLPDEQHCNKYYTKVHHVPFSGFCSVFESWLFRLFIFFLFFSAVGELRFGWSLFPTR